MNDLSLHILDIAQNSLKAGATDIYISVNSSVVKNILELVIRDNGKGMIESEVKQVINPFFTTRTKRRIGMGLSLLEQSATQAHGRLTVTSKLNSGTNIHVFFELNHIDSPVQGDMASSLITLFSQAINTDIYFEMKTDEKNFKISTPEIKKILHGVQINNPKILNYLKSVINSEIDGLKNCDLKYNIKH